MCTAIPVMWSEQQFQDFLQGKDVRTLKVTDVPEGFQQWVKLNADKIQTSKSLPYFLRDNEKWWKSTRQTPLQIAAQRHAQRTSQQVENIKKQWEQRQTAQKTYTSFIEEYGHLQGDFDFSGVNFNANYKTWERNVLNLKTDIDDYFAGYKHVANPLQLSRTYKLTELEAVENAVNAKLESLSTFSLQKQKDKLKFEIDCVETHKKYNTWKVAQDVYKKELDKVSWLIDKHNLQEQYVSLMTFKTKSTVYKKLLLEIDGELANKNIGHDLSKLKNAILKAEKKKYELETAAAKKTMSNLPASINPNALKFNNFDEVLNETFDDTDQWFRELTQAQRHAIIDYTESSGKFNRPLRGYRGNWDTYVGKGNVPFDYEGATPTEYMDLSDALGKIKTKHDMWTARGSNFQSFEGIFGADLSSMKPSEAKALIGRTGLDEGFVSTSPTAPWISNKIHYEIYLPKGTEAANIAPFSYYGGSKWSFDAENWVKLDRYVNMGEEEILINRGYTFQIIDIEKKGGTWIVKMTTLDRNSRFFK